jgi:hypothetical protein
MFEQRGHSMRTRIFLVAAAVALAAAASAFAGNGPGKGHGIRYAFLGQLAATPANGAVPITVEGGNRFALQAMLGQPVTQTFAYDTSTEFLKWSDGIPTIVQPGDLAAGDDVRVNVRDARGASLADIEQHAAGIVGDRGTQLFPPTQPLYLFRGTLTSVATTSVAVHVTGGNAHGMRLLLGQSADQSFAFDGQTIFLLWQGKVPTVINASQLKVGDRIVVRVRAAKGSSLGQVESTPAKHIGDREPAQP